MFHAPLCRSELLQMRLAFSAFYSGLQPRGLATGRENQQKLGKQESIWLQ